jgi:large subunit ribosomal protein L17
MRHRKAGRKLKRTASHRRALLASLSTSLLRHKRITTTVAKAKETRMVVEKMITRAKTAAALPADKQAAAVHARRMVGRLVKDKSVITELFSTIASRVAERAGGYTRIVKLGQRQGDGAEMAVIELVDFNTGAEPAEKTPAPAKAKKAAGRTPRKKKTPAAAPADSEEPKKPESR